MRIATEETSSDTVIDGGALVVTNYDTGAAEIESAMCNIAGRYPLKGWAVNRVCNEHCRIAYAGANAYVEVDGVRYPLFIGNRFVIKKGQRLYWQGPVCVEATCSPRFDPAQHEIIEE